MQASRRTEAWQNPLPIPDYIKHERANYQHLLSFTWQFPFIEAVRPSQQAPGLIYFSAHSA